MADERLSSTPQLDEEIRMLDDETGAYHAGVEHSTDPVFNNGSLGLEDYSARQMEEVVNSEIGVATLLNRLKQSIASAREFALFLKKRSALEDEHANGLKKICRVTYETIRRPDHKQGTYASQFDELARIHDRMADNGLQFSFSIYQMNEDLIDLANTMERGRKQWKQTGLSAEQKVADTETQMRKAKAKYGSLAEEYERARAGDRQSGKKFGLKGPKSAAQHEEDLLRKVQAADADYFTKVENARLQRKELLSTLRPQAVSALQDLIRECDSALTLQLQKFAAFNEKLLLSNGLCVSPIKSPDGKEPPNLSRSFRDVIRAIDDETDLKEYLVSHAPKVPQRASEIKYEKHPSLAQSIPQPASPHNRRPSEPSGSMGGSVAGTMSSRQGLPPTPVNDPPPPVQNTSLGAGYGQDPSPKAQQHERSFSQGPAYGQQNSTSKLYGNSGPAQHTYSGSTGSNGAPQLSNLPFQNVEQPPPPQQHAPISPSSFAQPPLQLRNNSVTPSNLLPLKPVFGMSLEDLFERDSSAIPLVVYQCIQAVDLFGLEVEGIYRLSGTATHINKLKAMFDNDASTVDFRVPENFFHDVNSVAGLLKQFFRDLPDPLLTREHYEDFVNAARHEDETVRRDSMHAIINGLPDPNYATLRALTLHLSRVASSAPINRMTVNNIAIVFGPTLTGGAQMEPGLAIRVVETILNHTYQIFDDDD